MEILIVEIDSGVTVDERKRGSLLGLAWGDVLGCPVEGWRKHEISQVYGTYPGLPESYPFEIIAAMGPRKVKRLRPLGLHSDDTQQALALIHVCLGREPWSVDAWADLLVAGMQAGAWRGYGRNFSTAVHALDKGTPPREAGSHSAGIGAAMRIAPLGAIYADRPDELVTVAMESSLMTHADIRTAATAFAIARAVAGFTRGSSPGEVRARLPQAVAEAEREWLDGRREWTIDRSAGQAVSTALEALLGELARDKDGIRKQVSELARPHLAPGFTKAHPNQGFVLLGGLHGLAMALVPDAQPAEVLSDIVRQGYDTDTVAAICGGVLGARFGTAWIPVDRFVDSARLEAYADSLARGGPLPEHRNDLLRREAELTRQEVDFQMQSARDWG
jgi:ADP-ribosylglycohydrolase